MCLVCFRELTTPATSSTWAEVTAATATWRRLRNFDVRSPAANNLCSSCQFDWNKKIFLLHGGSGLFRELRHSVTCGYGFSQIIFFFGIGRILRPVKYQNLSTCGNILCRRQESSCTHVPVDPRLFTAIGTVHTSHFISLSYRWVAANKRSYEQWYYASTCWSCYVEVITVTILYVAYSYECPEQDC